MDSFDKQIERYRQELVKYAEKHGTVYYEQDNNETVPKEEKAYRTTKYNAAYVSNRPMPREYDGNNDTVASPSGSSVIEETSANTPLYDNVDKFTADNTKSGKLRIQAYASQQVFPIQNAKVTVEKEFRNGRYLFNESYTDIDGIAQNIVLPAKDKRLSLTASGEIPYTTYTVTVSHPQFETLVFDRVPIFDSIESMQPAAMTPKADSLNSKVIMDTDAGTVRR